MTCNAIRSTLQLNSGAIDLRAEYEPFGTVYTLRAGASRHQPLRLPGHETAASDNEHEYNIFRWYRSGWAVYAGGIRRRTLHCDVRWTLMTITVMHTATSSIILSIISIRTAAQRLRLERWLAL